LSFRKEKKIRVSVSDYHKFQGQLHQQGMETLFEPRLITSVYFDTVDLDMFHDSEEGLLPLNHETCPNLLYQNTRW
jgi:hypothetical protein